MRDRVGFGLLVLWTASAPVLYGSVPEAEVAWPYLVFLTVGCLLLMTVLPPQIWELHDLVAPGAVSRRMLLLLALLALLPLLQLVPLPRFILPLLVPGHARDVAAILPERTFVAITTDSGLTGQAAGRALLLLGAGMAVLRFAGTPRRAWTLLGVIAGVAALGAAYGIVESTALGDRVLGLAKEKQGGGVTGTFFYRGSFAAFCATGLGIAAAGLVSAFRRRRPALAGAAAMALALLVAGILLSRSRAGLAAGGLALGVGLVLRLRSRRARWAVGALVLAAVAGGGVLVRERFAYMGGGGSHGFVDIRVPAWKATLDLAGGRPVLGAGLGAYRRAIHLTQSPDNPGELYYAHCDPLNLLAEGGVVGFSLGAGLAALGLFAALRLARDRDSPGSGAASAASAGLLGLLAMAAVDFPIQIPALALTLVVLLFLAVALDRGDQGGLALRKTLTVGVIAMFAAVFLFAEYRPAPGALTEGEASANLGYERLAEDDLDGAHEAFLEARERQPFEGATRYALARTLYRVGRFPEARAELAAALQLARGRAKLLFKIGEMAYRAGWPFAAEALREAAAIEPRYFPMALRELVDESMVPAIVPERGYAWRITGDWHRENGRWDEALAAWWRAFALGEGVERRLAAIYRREDREEEGRRRFEAEGVTWPE